MGGWMRCWTLMSGWVGGRVGYLVFFLPLPLEVIHQLLELLGVGFLPQAGVACMLPGGWVGG